MVGGDVQPIWFRWDEETKAWEPFHPHECRRLERAYRGHLKGQGHTGSSSSSSRGQGQGGYGRGGHDGRVMSWGEASAIEEDSDAPAAPGVHTGGVGGIGGGGVAGSGWYVRTQCSHRGVVARDARRMWLQNGTFIHSPTSHKIQPQPHPTPHHTRHTAGSGCGGTTSHYSGGESSDHPGAAAAAAAAAASSSNGVAGAGGGNRGGVVSEDSSPFSPEHAGPLIQHEVGPDDVFVDQGEW